jgi:hypothetical protein
VSQIARALDIHGLIIYLAGMTFILGALVFANHADDPWDKIKRRVARASCRMQPLIEPHVGWIEGALMSFLDLNSG